MLTIFGNEAGYFGDIKHRPNGDWRWCQLCRSYLIVADEDDMKSAIELVLSEE
jgi:hypothetical protein